jgi:hypothetical protein
VNISQSDEPPSTSEIVAFICQADDEPTLQEAMHSEAWPEWEVAIHQELAALLAMGVYKDVDELPPGKKPIGSKWVLLVKRDQNGDIDRYKA